MGLRQLCTVGIDYLGLSAEESSTDWASTKQCSYYTQVEDDSDHPSDRKRVCGNCTHYIVMEDK